ncbi:TAXI family TRAP transporter solute-binding subunit [Gulosibacter molinativorax]|uniref:TRAP transporter substrate-binding protein n=1 Tax=Gulosibacter molinativorax TaxID=256821 RepID=A0ABT7CA90_9MICO|nr:TAXI family TRAP transporter solute-binding subunit [Gulosibacter molinativorax]MDJ1371714.1 TRAP transporter substrate-binding protein [Gulosibacter molinativorax]QUY63135.1 TRAP transporter solute receptor, TAXI family [Gulosibacter molinativorax]
MTLVSRRTVLLTLGATVSTALTTSLFGCATGTQSSAIRLAAGEAGGQYFEFAGLLSAALRRRRALELEAVATSGSVENLDLLKTGTVDLAMSLADTATGSGHVFSTENGSAEYVAIGRVYQNYLQCIVRRDSDVQRFEDLVGRRISIGATGSGSAFTTRRILAVTGLDAGSNAPVLTEQLLEGAGASLASGEIDALFWSGGVPTAILESVGAVTPLRILDLAEQFAQLSDAYPNLYRLAEIPAGVYGSTTPTQTIGIANFLLTRPDLADATIASIVDVLVQDAASLVPEGSVGVQYLTLAGLIDTSPIALHPAALRRYRELYG